MLLYYGTAMDIICKSRKQGELIRSLGKSTPANDTNADLLAKIAAVVENHHSMNCGHSRLA